MSGHAADQRRDSEQYYYQSDDPHTSIPDWLPFAPGLSCEGRNLIMATMVLQKRGTPPTRAELATALHVDQRTVYRWLGELAAAGVMSTRRIGQRKTMVFHRAKPDRVISDRPISDRPISDHPITESRNSVETRTAIDSHETSIPDRAISDPTVGVGVGHDSRSKKIPTSTNRAPLCTPLARWLKRSGMNAAREFDDPKLDYKRYRSFVEDKRGMGWEWSQIVSTLREAPLEPPTLYETLERAGQLAPAEDDFLPEVPNTGIDTLNDVIDSTSRALARRFEQDKAEALARGAGLVDERGIQR